MHAAYSGIVPQLFQTCQSSPPAPQLEKHNKALSTVAKQIQFQFQNLSAAFLTSVLVIFVSSSLKKALHSC